MPLFFVVVVVVCVCSCTGGTGITSVGSWAQTLKWWVPEAQAGTGALSSLGPGDLAHTVSKDCFALEEGWQLLPCGFEQKIGSEGTSGSGFGVCRDPSCLFRACWTLQSLWGCVQCLKACDCSTLRSVLQGQWLLLTSLGSNSTMCHFLHINSSSHNQTHSFHSHWIMQSFFA